MRKIPERFTWAAEIIAPRPDDQLLEIGCGAGLLAQVLLTYLKNGSLTAVEISAAMCSKAAKGNHQAIIDRKFHLLQNDFLDVSLPRNSFDKVVAFNVNLLMKKPAEFCRQVRSLLKPRAKLYFFYQFPYQVRQDASHPLKEKLEDQKFKVEQVFFQSMEPSPVIGLVASDRTTTQ